MKVMTREEEIMKASQNETKKFSNFLVSAPVFRMGARWADRTMIEKSCEWLKLFCSENYIMNYTDCCEIPTEQVIESFKKWIEGEEDSTSQEPEETEKKKTP